MKQTFNFNFDPNSNAFVLDNGLDLNIKLCAEIVNECFDIPLYTDNIDIVVSDKPMKESYRVNLHLQEVHFRDIEHFEYETLLHSTYYFFLQRFGHEEVYVKVEY